MTPMPEKPYTWAMVLAWLHQHAPIVYAALATFLMAFLGVMRRGGTICQALLEAPMCMLMTLGLIPVLEHFELPHNLAIAAGVWIGYFGVRKVAGWVQRIAKAKLPGA